MCIDGLFLGKLYLRVYGVFLRILGKFVREFKVLKLEEVIMKMISKVVSVIRIKDRGMFKEGYFVDIVIFNKYNVKDIVIFENLV